MNDKELLELAAKAAGIKKDDSPYNGGGHGNDGFSITGAMMLDWANNKRWNPLTDDGDALRLAVKLSFDIHVDSNLTEVIYLNETTEAHLGDPYAATRRAIVRAAAEIGKAMK